MNYKTDALIGIRAKLVPMDRSHVPGLFEAGRHDEIWQYMPVQVRSLDDMASIVDKALAAADAGAEYPFVIIDQVSERIVGSTRFLDILPSHRNLEIGWTWHDPAVWRTRINTETKYLLLTHCFETAGTIRVCLKTDGRNLRSQSAIERIGGVKEGILRNHRILLDGYIRDSVYYSIIDTEWPQVKLRLEAMLED